MRRLFGSASFEVRLYRLIQPHVLLLRRRANARNVSFSNSLLRLIYLYQLPVDNQLVVLLVPSPRSCQCFFVVVVVVLFSFLLLFFPSFMRFRLFCAIFLATFNSLLCLFTELWPLFFKNAGREQADDFFFLTCARRARLGAPFST